MKELKLKFVGDQEHQLAPIKNTISLFDGLKQIGERNFTLKPEQVTADEIVSNLPEEIIFDEQAIIENLNIIQEENILKDGLLQATSLDVNDGMVLEGAGNESFKFPEFTIEMETGTGKTYVYLRTIIELSLKYGFVKFIIVVPSIAIYEGVKKSFDITRDHFRSIYANHMVNLNQYDSSRMGIIRNFATSTTTEVMLITLDSFNKASNVIYRASEKLPGELKPFQFIQKTRPIVIMDEPQNMESETAKAAIRTLHPLFSLRYSATHRTNPNQIYRLSPVDAFLKNLVKKIQVIGITEETCSNKPYIELLSVNVREKKASIRTNVNKDGQMREAEIIVKHGGDLFSKTENEHHKKGYIVEEINQKGGGFIKFENGDKVTVNDSMGPTRREIFRIQIRETIEQHMKMQERLRDKGIKVLSLFFIDRVANYMDDDGVIRIIFDEEFSKIKRKHEFYKKVKSEEVRKAYFSVMRHKKKGGVEVEEYLDGEATNNTQREAEKEAYELIMKDKERLLSFEEPVCFIFAHSALKEGWDNPNVFQICTLNQTFSQMRKRQEIGRGLRLCVNQDGERIHDEEINVLTVIANESYERYASELQKNYEEDGELTLPPKPSDATKKRVRINKDLIDGDDFTEFWKKLNKSTRYTISLDSHDLISVCIEKLNNTQFPSPRYIVQKSEVVFVSVKLLLKEVKRNKAKIRIDIIDSEGNETNTTAMFSVDDNLGKKLNNEHLKEFLIIEIKGEEVYFGNDAILDTIRPIEFQIITGRKPLEKTISHEKEIQPVFNLIERGSSETGLTRRTINSIFKGLNSSKKQHIFENPEGFAGVFIATVKEYLSDHLSKKIQYSIVKEEKSPYNYNELFPEEPEMPQKELIEAGPTALYNQVQIDSEIEKNFVNNQLKNDDKVKLYFKFPPKYKVQVPSIIGNYNPDWGIVRIDDAGKSKLELVRETKGNLDKTKLRFSNEGRKIRCGEKHFAALGIDYRYITDKTARWWDPTEEDVQGKIVFLKDYENRKYKDTLPVYSLKAACGKFGEGQNVEPEGWVEVPPKKGMGEGWFLAQAIGKSMDPKITDGSYCIFKPVSAGTKEGRILLIQHRDISDPENGGKYTLKRYTRDIQFDASGNEIKKIILKPENNAFEPIILQSKDEDYENQFQVIGEFVGLYE